MLTRSEYNKARNVSEDLQYAGENGECPCCNGDIDLETPDEDGYTFWFCKSCKWESQMFECEPEDPEEDCQGED